MLQGAGTVKMCALMWTKTLLIAGFDERCKRSDSFFHQLLLHQVHLLVEVSSHQ